MKKIILIIVVIVVVVYAYNRCHNTSTPINGYVGTVESVEGNVLNLVSGIHVQLLGVESSTSVEMFLRNNFINKDVTLYADSHDMKQTIDDPYETLNVYVVENDKNTYCINRQVVMEYHDAYNPVETLDSVGWIEPSAPLVEKKDLALYMKQRTFLIITPHGGGTGFFINEDGLAVTNYHVLAPGEENKSVAVFYEDDPEDSGIYEDKKRNFKNIKFSSNLDELDITIVSVELENGEKVPYFDIAKQRPKQGDKVATYGNPKWLTASYSSGEISAFRSDPFNPNRNVQLVQYTMSTNGGNSGGPVCDIYGQIVAIHELGDKSAQNINYGIDAMQLREVLDALNLKYGGKY
ncbi:MAG: serine protease [Prevotella sp.]|nr:serine protease [Prevotella sp.]